MRDLLVFGVGKFSEVAAHYFETEGDFQVSAFVVDDDYFTADNFQGRPVLRASELPGHPLCRGFFFAAVGYSRNNFSREEKVKWLCSLGLTPASFVSEFAYVAANVVLGTHCFILENNVVQPFVEIGDNVVLWSGNHIGHHVLIESHCFIASHVVIAGGVNVGEGVFLGINASLVDGVNVGARCVVGAAAVVVEDVEAGALVVSPYRSRIIPGGASYV